MAREQGTRTAQQLEELAQRAYPYGFVTAVESESMPPGLNEDTIRAISAKKREPQFMLDWRLRAYRHWITLERTAAEPRWANITYPPIDSYRALPTQWERPICFWVPIRQ